MDEQGLNDAAIMLMSLGEEEAAEVFKHLSPKEVQRLGEAMRTLKRRALLEDLLMPLCVVAYGDADWRLVREVAGG